MGALAAARFEPGAAVVVDAKPVVPQVPTKNAPPVMPPQSELMPPGEVPTNPPATAEGDYKR